MSKQQLANQTVATRQSANVTLLVPRTMDPAGLLIDSALKFEQLILIYAEVLYHISKQVTFTLRERKVASYERKLQRLNEINSNNHQLNVQASETKGQFCKTTFILL